MVATSPTEFKQEETGRSLHRRMVLRTSLRFGSQRLAEESWHLSIAFAAGAGLKRRKQTI